MTCLIHSDIVHSNKSYFIYVDAYSIKEQRFGEVITSACDKLSANGISNYIHYNPTRVQLDKTYIPVTDCVANRVILDLAPDDEQII
jgi:hypothetical protein